MSFNKKHIATIAMETFQKSFDENCKEISLSIPGNSQELMDFFSLLCQAIDNRNFNYYTNVDYDENEKVYIFSVNRKDTFEQFIWNYNHLFDEEDEEEEEDQEDNTYPYNFTKVCSVECSS